MWGEAATSCNYSGWAPTPLAPRLRALDGSPESVYMLGWTGRKVLGI